MLERLPSQVFKIYYRAIVKVILIKNQNDTGTETGMQINGIKLKTQT